MYVLVNAAVSVDGKLSTVSREQVAISGPDDFRRVDELRSDVDAVMVGIGTVLADDPSLTVDRPVAEQPARIVVDSRARTPPTARILNDMARTFVVTTREAARERVEALASAPSTTVLTAGAGRVALDGALEQLDEAGIDRLLVEGGGELIFSLFAEDLVDELSVYVGDLLVGGADAPTLADGSGFPSAGDAPRLDLESVTRIDDGVLLRWRVPGAAP